MRALKFENMLIFGDIRYGDFLKADETFILIFTESQKFTKIPTIFEIFCRKFYGKVLSGVRRSHVIGPIMCSLSRQFQVECPLYPSFKHFQVRPVHKFSKIFKNFQNF